MIQSYIARNEVDKYGNPAGGRATGTGIEISFQDGPRGLDEKGNLGKENGAFVETLLDIVRIRLEFFQRTRFNCPENEVAISDIKSALYVLDRRSKDRAARGVEGKNII